VAAEQHHQAADHLDGVRDEHHPALGDGVGEGADEGREHDVEQREHRHQRGALPLGGAEVRSSSTAATNKALSASELKNCADMMVEKPFFIVRRGAPFAARSRRRRCAFGERLRARDALFSSGGPVLLTGGCSCSGARFIARDFGGARIRRLAECEARKHRHAAPDPSPRCTCRRAGAQPGARARQAAPDARVWAVVKANAYGHGIERVYAGLRAADGFRAARPRRGRAPARAGLARAGPAARRLLRAARPGGLLAAGPVAHGALGPSRSTGWRRTRRTKPQHVFLKMNSGMNRLGFKPEVSAPRGRG
jgi:hypothetical protein